MNCKPPNGVDKSAQPLLDNPVLLMTSLPTGLPAVGARRDNPLAAIGFIVLAMALFAIMDTLAKLLSAGQPILLIVLFRSLGALIVLTPVFLRQPASHRRLIQPRLLALRVVLGTTAVTLFFMAIAKMSLADVAAINFSSPLMVTLLSIVLLKERVGPRRWLALLVGFAGVLVILRPGGGVLSQYALFAVGGTLCYAVLMIILRLQGQIMTSATSSFWFTLFSPLLVLPAMPAVWVTPDPGDLAMLLILGMVGGLAMLSMTQAMRLAPASTVAPFDYSYLIWAVAAGWFLFGDLPSPSSLMGLPLIIGSGLYILHRETIVNRRPKVLEAEAP
ncbi:Protein of unknown function DUF6, transmembrane [Rhodospirillum rubrum ATCC 11170]|uniref:EamA domain-containing protein n=2 Tax=Rhodospirillum rubrum TaxID=1085 RepID=Q2RYC0_RHORT|nr:Protein of unknown function DUF6, transmembrane [Rhodospirillum rubrum ATCC 11170]MBK5952433.1 EamA family transporter [Rhodospirillum rubrum]HAP98903.1 EamA/RhaT family transporter [Rhodospirillum rubrum]HCF17943.1 EamA/RhaT family transporter [Rhodospirillum rubrum]